MISSPRKRNLFGLNIDDVDFEGALDLIESLVEGPPECKGYVVTPNVDHIVKLQQDNEFRAVYHSAAAVFADGMPLVWASRLLGRPLKERIAGADLLPAICKYAASKKKSIFFLGGLTGVAEKAKMELEVSYPGLCVIGTYSPPYGFENNEEENIKIVEMINKKMPQILFVGLGAPKQEKWIAKHIKHLNIKVALCTGAAFDFVAGTVKRAPLWMQRYGFEWFYRLTSEPKRLWKRYLIDDLLFLKLLLDEHRQRNKHDNI